MKAILTVGYQDILFPNETVAMQAMKALSKGIVVRDRSHRGVVEIEDDFQVKLELKITPVDVTIVDNRSDKKQLRLK